MKEVRRFAGTLACVLAFLMISFLDSGIVARAQDRNVSSSGDFGGIGLLQTRTARMAPDGQFDVGISTIEPYNRVYINVQAFPWLEATFRYTEVTNELYSPFPDFSGAQSFKDRGADIKVQLLREAKYLPAIAVGVQDGLGTGVFSGEYVVVNKRYFDLDFSMGIGWGYNGLRGNFENPLLQVSETFRIRGGEEAGSEGGTPTFSSYFSGERIDLFGGIEYAAPVKGLTLKWEYDGNDYKKEPLGNRGSTADVPYNFGFNYRPFPWIDTSLAWERGNTFMGRVSLRANFHEVGIPKLLDKPPLQLESRPSYHMAPEELANDVELNDNNTLSSTLISNTSEEIPATHLTLDPDTSIAKRFPVSVDNWNLLDRLAAEGLEAESIVILPHQEAKIFVKNTLPDSQSEIIQRVSQIILYSESLPVERITLIQLDGEFQGDSFTLEQHDIKVPSPNDYMLDRMADDGFEVLSLEFSHVEAKIYVSHSSHYKHSLAEVRAADTVFKTAPVPLERVTLIHIESGKETARFTAKRGETIKEASEGLFDGLAHRGLSIQSVELLRRRIIIRASANSINHGQVYRTIAQYLSELVSDDIDEVVLVAVQDGVEQNHLIIYPSPTPDSTLRASLTRLDESATERVSIRSKDEIASQMFHAFEEHSFHVDAVFLGETKAEVYVTPRTFREVARNVGRASRVLANIAPSEIESFTIIQTAAGLESSRITVMRGDLERAVSHRGSMEEIWGNAVIERPNSKIHKQAIRNPDRYPSFRWRLTPRMRSHVGGPDQFFLYQYWVALSADVELLPGLRVRSVLGRNLYNNFDRITLVSDSVLPRVRSDIKEYLQQGENNLVRLQADYMFSPRPDWYLRATAGIFEEMFGGYGGEILYRPFDSRWAMGIDYFYARQRAFDQRFDFLDYEVNTGHVNFYYDMPWYNVLASVHVGHYLARDKGGTIFLSRLFDSGVRAGAWTTLTNVSKEDFGEGSFDKGFFISVPLELFFLKSNRRVGVFAWRPLSRDGGQMLGGSQRLYDATAEGRLQNIADDWDKFLN